MNNFKTEDGMNVTAVTTEQMIEIDRIAMEETGPNLFQMMENAGRNLAVLTIDHLGKNWKETEILVLAGTGGNGGGGICAARHLANRGANVRLCITSPERLKQVPKLQKHIYDAAGGMTIEFNEIDEQNPALIIDAVIGYSLKAAPRGSALKFIEFVNSKSTEVISLDVPSGIDSTTGKAQSDFIRAAKTLTLALPKTGLASEDSGELYLADIGIPIKTYRKLKIDYVTPFNADFIVRLLPAV